MGIRVVTLCTHCDELHILTFFSTPDTKGVLQKKATELPMSGIIRCDVISIIRCGIKVISDVAFHRLVQHQTHSTT